MSVDLPAPFGPSRPRISPRRRFERDAGEGSTPTEVPGHVGEANGVEIDRRHHAARPARSAGSGPSLVAVERAVDVFKGREHLFAASVVARLDCPAIAALVFEADEFAK